MSLWSATASADVLDRKAACNSPRSIQMKPWAVNAYSDSNGWCSSAWASISPASASASAKRPSSACAIASQ